jgi:import inner membrane translocase subunit TIM50
MRASRLAVPAARLSTVPSSTLSAGWATRAAARQTPHTTPSGAPGLFRRYAQKSKDDAQDNKPNDVAQDSEPTDKTSDPSKNPFAHLPDLTRGIPSTFEYEQSQRASALAEVYTDDSAGGRERGELPASAYISSTDRRRKALTRRLLIVAAAGALASFAYLGRDWDDAIDTEKHPDAPNGWSLTGWWKRLWSRMSETVTYYHEPAFEKLLPELDPMYARPYTLVISLEDLLVHSEWTRDKGWRFVKRPGMDYFIRYLSQYYEIVLFSSTPMAIAEPIVRKLDPYRFIMWPLFREGTKWKDGEMVKDLSYLNRNLSKVIMVECDEKFVRNQPENAIVLPKWKGDPKDQELVALIPFLEYIHTVQSPDVRKVLKSFDGKHIPTEFAKREAIARKAFNERLKNGKSKGKLGLGAFGMKGPHLPDGEQDPAEALAQGKMLQDIARERGQRNYMMIEKEIRENGEKWLKEEQEVNDKAQKEFMSSIMSTAKSTLIPWHKDEQANNANKDETKP